MLSPGIFREQAEAEQRAASEQHAAAAEQRATVERAAAERAAAGAWVDVADENDVVRVPSGTRLRFGAGTRWVEKTAGLLPFFATNDQFGSDPAPGTRKKVQRWQPAGGAAAPAGGDAGCTPQ